MRTHSLTIRQGARTAGAFLLGVWIVLAPGSTGPASGQTTDVKQVPLWDGETSATPDGDLINRFGGPVVHLGDTKTTVRHVTDVVHTGCGAYRADLAGTVKDFAFFQLALSGFGPTKQYVMSRDLGRFDSLCFWLKNGTGVSFTLKLEIKDYRDTNDHVMVRRYSIPSHSSWMRLCAALPPGSGWQVTGAPDLQRAWLIGFVFEAQPKLPLQGAVHFDDVVLVEPGTALDAKTASLSALVQHLAHRQFDGLWGSRSRTHGLVPLNSAYADVAALNSTAAVVKLLPVACEHQWITPAQANEYLTVLLTTLNTLMDRSKYLPPRYADWVTLQPNFMQEESPIDAAFLALALYQYEFLPATPASLRTKIKQFLTRLDFRAFGSTKGWRLAYRADPPGFTEGTYDGYSGEIWTISLAAHLMPAHQVDIKTYYHSGILRTPAYLTEASLAHVVHTDPRFRAPFLQWLFPLFVDLEDYGADSYPVKALATNPLRNAILYQKDMDHHLTALGRSLFLQPEAGDDGSGAHYEQYSCYNSSGAPDLFMPWSAAFTLRAEPDCAAASLRNSLSNGLHGPYGLSDSVHWQTGRAAPDQVTARNDFWNTALATMALVSFLDRDSRFLSDLPEVRSALREVFP